jgi:hypothetical protein
MMAKVSTSNGSFALKGNDSRSVAYFSSTTGNDEWILNICTDPDDEASFYVVGATGGQMDETVTRSKDDLTIHALVSKVRTNDLSVIWTTQFAVTHSSGKVEREVAAVALGCAVIPGQGRIFVAGDVENGAILKGSNAGTGGDDIFVSMLETTYGNKVWLKQIGSSGDDRIARAGGIVSDANGNAVVYGDTTGDYHRIRRNRIPSKLYSDLFLMVFNQEDGSHEPSLSKAWHTQETEPGVSVFPFSEWFGPNGLDGENNLTFYNDSKIATPILVTLLVVFFLMVTTCCFYRLWSRKQTENKRNDSIFTYLQRFAVDDIDLRRVPTGGWHGTYLNDLSHGINHAAQDIAYIDNDTDNDTETFFESLESKQKNTRGSTFMDTPSKPMIGDTYEEKDGTYRNGNEGNSMTASNEEKLSFSICVCP